MQRNHDFSAFRQKMRRPVALHLERREAPNLAAVAESIEKIADRTEDFMREQRSRLDKLETRLARPGALVHEAATSKQAGPALIDTRTGRQMLEIRAGDDVESKYRSAGLLTGSESDGPTFADFIRAIAGQKSSELAVKTLSVGTDSAGGHMVPSALMPSVLRALTATSSLLQAGARIVPVGDFGDGAKTYTWAAVDTLPTAAWRSENGSVAESDPTFRSIVATARSLAFYFKVSRELLNDAGNLERALPEIIGQAFAVALDRPA